METVTTLEGKTGILYNNIVFEPRAAYGEVRKKQLRYDASLADVKSRRYTRHPRPQEVFSLLIADLENKLTPEQKSVADDILNSYGEWLSTAVERNGNRFTIYTDPEGLVWNGLLYVKQNFRFESKRDFSAAGVASATWVDLNKFGSDLVEFLYTRKFEQLPQVMREGDRRAQVYLPPDGQIWPAGLSSFYNRFNIDCRNYDSRASRGVVPQEQLLEEKLAEELSRLDKYVGNINDTPYKKEKKEILQEFRRKLTPK